MPATVCDARLSFSWNGSMTPAPTQSQLLILLWSCCSFLLSTTVSWSVLYWSGLHETRDGVLEQIQSRRGPCSISFLVFVVESRCGICPVISPSIKLLRRRRSTQPAKKSLFPRVREMNMASYMRKVQGRAMVMTARVNYVNNLVTCPRNITELGQQ